jgi:hypothetical protein
VSDFGLSKTLESKKEAIYSQSNIGNSKAQEDILYCPYFKNRTSTLDGSRGVVKKEI